MATTATTTPNQPVTYSLLVIFTVDPSTDEHLQLLALVAQAFSDPALRARLAMAADATEVRSILCH